MTQSPPADAARITLATPPRMALADIAARLPAALDGGAVACVRLDMAGADENDIRRAADTLRPICHERDIALIVSEHFRLAGPLGLDGAEVDGAKVRLRDARAEIGADRILGVRCGTSRHAGMTAAEAGADYVLFAPVVPAPGLGDGSRAEPDLFAWWAEMIETPVVAEGGVGPAEALALGADADFVVPDAAIWEGDLPAALAALDRALREASADAA